MGYSQRRPAGIAQDDAAGAHRNASDRPRRQHSNADISRRGGGLSWDGVGKYGCGWRSAWAFAIALILLSCQTDAASQDIPDPSAAADCANGIAVPNPESNPALVRDCSILLRILDSLSQSEAARPPIWDVNVPLSQWEGVNLGGVPTRVVGVTIRERRGRYPEHEYPRLLPALARLDGLRKLVIEGSFARGPIPSEIGNLSNLEELIIDGAPQRDYMSHQRKRPKLPPPKDALGPMPPELGGIRSLNTLVIRRASLKGTMPRELGNLARLERLELDDNFLAGEIPPDLGRLRNLKTLNLSWNILSGHIPPELGDLDKVERLDLGVNRIAGNIPPELGGLANVVDMNLVGNRIWGEIPPSLGGLPRIENMELASNRLSGEIPPELGKLRTLNNHLSLGWNNLSGEIPPELGELENLESLNLARNRLSGEIPPELGGMRRLQSVNLADNNLSGEIPSALGGAPDLRMIHLGGNDFIGCVPQEFARESVIVFNPIGLPFCGSPGEATERGAPSPPADAGAPEAPTLPFYAALALAGAVFAVGGAAMFTSKR